MGVPGVWMFLVTLSSHAPIPCRRRWTADEEWSRVYWEHQLARMHASEPAPQSLWLALTGEFGFRLL